VDIKKCVIATQAINYKFQETREKLNDSFREKLPKNGATLLFRECDEGIETDQRKYVTHLLGGVKFFFKAGEFFQNNYYVLPLLVEHVINVAKGDGCDILIDTYCGSGLFALSSSKLFNHVYGVEISDIAVNSAIECAKINGINNAEFICGASEAIFSKVSMLPSFKAVVIIDPPRKGCDQAFLEQLINFKPKKIVYVSCDPATQARDCKYIIQEGYKITDVTPFDLFPQTRHIENVITFLRN
jgi:23S rRNA (uracil1939-C5)-methyltransferase/tRNA (uracil-5-)-methyltransferase